MFSPNRVLGSNKVRVHLAIAIGAWALLFLFWIIFREWLPLPETVSQILYISAFLSISWVVWNVPDKAMRRRYLVFPLIAFIVFMDEIAWGTEWGLPRIYLADLDVYVYDLHNLFTLVIELV